ncbi:ankyrin repeat domain-containing protein SOWAHA [Lepisosteus oculatus]|uniref:ankyrin repeat domain-containing protein SOWAHA n=1 Tax=Lepisosteus oculatus TaxID=7918 RepID=UPI0035F51003
MGELSEDSLLDYLRAAGGRVKNSDLLKAYKDHIGHSDQRLRATYREQFKAIVDKIAVVKTAENGEKQLVLRKKFAPQGPRPAARVQWDGGEAAAGSSPQAQAGTRGAAAGSPKEQKKAVLVPWEMAPAITVAETPEPSRPEERPAPPLALEPDKPPEAAALRRIPEDGRAEEPGEESPTPSLQEEEPEPDAVSKSESERDDDGSGSVGSHGVALDPLEKEWMRSAACGQLAHLAQLLKQEPSLACKKDFTSFTALHWAAKHGREDMAAALAGAGADVNCRAGYTPLHIAALHGHRHIIDLLIQTYGAREDLRDYSGHKALQYLGTQEIHKEGRDLQYLVPQGSERRTKKLGSLFQPKTAGGSTKKKWGSVEDLAGSDEKGGPQLLIPPTFRPRKFSR